MSLNARISVAIAAAFAVVVAILLVANAARLRRQPPGRRGGPVRMG